jgi:hypothetical protein
MLNQSNVEGLKSADLKSEGLGGNRRPIVAPAVAAR